MWYDDPLLCLAMGLLGSSLAIGTTVGVCLILLWYGRRRQKYAYDRLPINWGEPLITERTIEDVVAQADVQEIQEDLIQSLAERARLRAELAEAHARLARAERARVRHLATVRRLRGAGPSVQLHVPELWTQDLGPEAVRKVSP